MSPLSRLPVNSPDESHQDDIAAAALIPMMPPAESVLPPTSSPAPLPPAAPISPAVAFRPNATPPSSIDSILPVSSSPPPPPPPSPSTSSIRPTPQSTPPPPVVESKPPTMQFNYSIPSSPSTPLVPPPLAFGVPPPPVTLSSPTIPTHFPIPSPLVNESSQTTSNVRNPSSIHLVGISVMVPAIVLVLLIILIVYFMYCKSKTPIVKDKSYDGQHFKQKIHPPAPLVIGVPAKPFPQQLLMSCSGDSSSNDSGSEYQISPQVHCTPLGFSATIFTYKELVAATRGLEKLGEGGFGCVYRGMLPNGKEIAVKQLKMGSRQGEREFQAEVETISRVHHKHLVSLVGYCIDGPERLLVYEFVPNNTLEFHLHRKGQPIMEWANRLKIAIGSAKGLAYLHEDCNPTIIHRDIKAANILLDSKFEAKVSDFGLAKFFSDTNHHISHISTRVMGTFGYLDPEYALSGKASDKSDVFSYGVMLLELITGRQPINATESLTGESLVTWARPLLMHALEDGNFDTLADPLLQRNYNNREMARMVACAAACVRHSAWLRPQMSQIVRALEGGISITDLDEGIRSGHSTICDSYESLNYDFQQLKEEMDRFNMISASQESKINGYSESTSEYGLH